MLRLRLGIDRIASCVTGNISLAKRLAFECFVVSRLAANSRALDGGSWLRAFDARSMVGSSGRRDRFAWPGQEPGRKHCGRRLSQHRKSGNKRGPALIFFFPKACHNT